MWTYFHFPNALLFQMRISDFMITSFSHNFPCFLIEPRRWVRAYLLHHISWTVNPKKILDYQQISNNVVVLSTITSKEGKKKKGYKDTKTKAKL